MIPSDSRDRFFLLVTGFLILFAPVLIIWATLGVLILFGDLALGQISPIEFLELYIIDLILFVGLAYGVYRLTLRMVRHRLPDALDALDSDEDAGTDAEAEPVEER